MAEISDTIKNLKDIFDSSLEGVVISDMRRDDEPIIYCNKMFTSMTGYKPEEVIGKNCRFLQGHEKNQPGLYVLRSALSANQPCKVVLKNYRKNGELFYNRLSIFPVKNDMDEVTHYMGIQDDITAMIDTKNKFLETLEEKQVLLSEVHHRVKNNLAVISAMLDMESYNEDSEHSLQKSKLRIKSMALVHENIYKENGLAKISYDHFLKEFTQIVKDQQNEDATIIDFTYNLKNIELNVNQAIPLSIGVGEILDNIYKHAFGRMEHGEAHLHLSRDNDHIKLEISDTGKGVPENFSLENSSKTGLIICSQVFSQIDASFEVKNISDGAVFKIEFKQSNEMGSSQHNRIEE